MWGPVLAIYLLLVLSHTCYLLFLSQQRCFKNIYNLISYLASQGHNDKRLTKFLKKGAVDTEIQIGRVTHSLLGKEKAEIAKCFLTYPPT